MAEKDYSQGAAYVYGQYVSLEGAVIPIWDMGFMHADVCYDVISTWNGNFFRLKDHLKRFRNTLAGFRMHLGLDDAAMTEIMMECIRLTGLRNTYVYIISEDIMSGDKPGPISVNLKNRYWEKREAGWHATLVQ
jgi:branched-chain amino acid aminotransferase